MLGALLAILLLTGAVPVYAAEQTEMPDYFGIQSDAVKTTTGHTFTLSYGRPGEEVYDSFEVTDDFYYAIEPDGQITVTNTNPSDTGFVYMYCEVYYPKTSMTGYDGSTIQIPGGYFCDVDEDLYYLGENGQWISVWYGYWLLGAVTEDDRPGKLLDYGESCTFRLPDATVTRAEAVTFLWRAAGSPEPTSLVSPYTDVTNRGSYYYKAVLWAAEQGITGGIGNNQFGPTVTLAYDQILTMLCRAMGESAAGSDWSAAAVSWASKNDLTDGLTFSAKANCPRSDVVYCLWKQLSDGTPIQPGGQDQTSQGPTEQEVYNAIVALKADYPEGMRWTNDNYYHSDAMHLTGYGCEGFALICSDTAFGDLPARTHTSFDQIRVGDLIRVGNYHTIVVLEKKSNSVIVTEGNFNSSIHWGREVTRASLEQSGFSVRTRYPEA